MPLDFMGQTLVGRSFAGRDLADADFRLADIRSADFSGANLSGANFQQATAGLSKRWQIVQILALLLCCTTIGIMAIVAGTFISTFLTQANIDEFKVIPGLLVLIMFAGVSLPIIIQGFTTAAFQNVVITGSISIVAICIGIVFLSAPNSTDSAGGMTGGLVLLIVNTVLLTVAGLTGGRALIGLCVGWSSVIAILTYPLIYPKAIAAITPLTPNPYNRLGMIAFIMILLLSGTNAALRVLARDEKFDFIQRLATTFTAQGGTCFRNANLTDANFTQAKLKCTSFSSAQIRRTHFYRSQQLNTAHLASTILVNTLVRQLAVSRNGDHQSYAGLNLTGLNLTQATLIGSDFTDSTLSHATLQQAIATDANFTRTQAISTQFQAAQITGSCVEAWNIDSTTQLEEVSCQYIYLRSSQQERRPSSGQFQAGEFTKLFQEVIETIDLIFQGGIDWKALHSMLDAENAERPQSEPLTLRSIENKNDGVVVVRVDSPPEADKSLLHADLTHKYQGALQTLKVSYQAQLQAKDEQIAIYREQQADLSAIAKSLANRPVTLPVSDHTPDTQKLITLRLSAQNDQLQTAIQASLQIGYEGKLPFVEHTGILPPAASLYSQYQQWQTSYQQLIYSARSHRIAYPPVQITNVSIQSIQQEICQHSQQVNHSFNQWLDAEEFRSLKETLLENLNPDDTTRIVLSADDPRLWQLPWQNWGLLNRYPKAEITLSTHQYKHISKQSHRHKNQSSQVKILSVLGDDDGLDLRADCEALRSLPNATVTVLTAPNRQTLNDHLWEQSWDILFFAGHSSSHQGEGYLRINATDSLSLPDIRHALQKASQRGLQLAIFNSCDGLGLVNNLSHLSLPQMIVMRESVPNLVAQAFLKGLLSAFAEGQPLPQAVRAAREKLQGLEDRFPCATWLPVLCQTATTAPLTWEMLRGGKE